MIITCHFSCDIKQFRGMVVLKNMQMATFCLLLAWTLILTSAEPGCPPVGKDSMGICLEECGTSSDCEAAGKSGHLCCSNGCGHVCTPVASSKKAPSAKPYELMAAVAEVKAFSVLKGIVPPPLSSSELRGVKILMLKYDVEHKQEACLAFRKLQGHNDVKSVDWDGPAPNCAEIEL